MLSLSIVWQQTGALMGIGRLLEAPQDHAAGDICVISDQSRQLSPNSRVRAVRGYSSYIADALLCSPRRASSLTAAGFRKKRSYQSENLLSREVCPVLTRECNGYAEAFAPWIRSSDLHTLSL